MLWPHPDLTKEVEDRGHDVVSHSKEHANLANLSSDQLKLIFPIVMMLFKEVLGHTPKNDASNLTAVIPMKCFPLRKNMANNRFTGALIPMIGASIPSETMVNTI